MPCAADYFRWRAVRLFALVIMLREKGNADNADAVAAAASQSLDEAVALHARSLHATSPATHAASAE